MSTTMGRHYVEAEPKDRQVALRATATTVKQFAECAQITGKTKTNLLEEMITRLYTDLTTDPNKKQVERGANEMTDKERKDTQQAILYELRRLLDNGDKDTYTKEELCKLLDTIAEAKAQE